MIQSLLRTILQGDKNFTPTNWADGFYKIFRVTLINKSVKKLSNLSTGEIWIHLRIQLIIYFFR